MQGKYFPVAVSTQVSGGQLPVQATQQSANQVVKLEQGLVASEYAAVTVIPLYVALSDPV